MSVSSSAAAAFTVCPFPFTRVNVPVKPVKPFTTKAHTPKRRPRPRPPAITCSQRLPYVPPPPQDSYLQCVECLAVYHVDSDELEGSSRIVSCTACLHEWTAGDADLLWGYEEARAALDLAAKRRVEGSAFRAARGVVEAEQENNSAGKERETNQRKSGSYGRREVDGRRYPRERRWQGRERGELSERGRQRTGRAEGNGYQGHGRASVEDKRIPRRGNSGDEGRREDEREDDHGEDSDRFNVFVGNLSFRATEEDLYRAFSGYGAVLKCQVPSDESGASKGYGFVEMRSRENGLRAIESLQGTSILGRDVSLNEAKPRRVRPRRWVRRPNGGSGKGLRVGRSREGSRGMR